MYSGKPISAVSLVFIPPHSLSNHICGRMVPCRYLSLVPSLLVIVLSFGKIRMISARENKKELAKAGYKYELGPSEKTASATSTSEGGSTRKKKSAEGSDAPTSERESEKEGNDAKKSKLAAAKPASPAAAPTGRQQ